MKKKLKSIDLFGHPIPQNFNRSGMTHQTCLGAFCSIFLYAFMLLYIGLNVKILYFKEANSLSVLHSKSDAKPLEFKTNWLNQIYRYTGPQKSQIVEDNEETRKYISFDYYYRAVNWKYTDESQLYTDTAIGKRIPTQEDFSHDPQFE